MARARHVALLLCACLGPVSSQDVADCTWRPQQDAAEDSSLECQLKTLQTGSAVIPQVRPSVNERENFHSKQAGLMF